MGRAPRREAEAKLGREREWPEIDDLELEINGDYDSLYALEQKS